MISFREQIVLIIYYLIFGHFLAAMYDIIHFYLGKFVARKANPTKFGIYNLISYTIELVFWLGLSYLACLYIMKTSKGTLTIYIFLFFALGILNHFYFLHNRFIGDLERANHLFIKIYKRLKKVIIIIVYPKSVVDVMNDIKIFIFKKIKAIKIPKIFKKKKQDKDDALE